MYIENVLLCIIHRDMFIYPARSALRCRDASQWSILPLGARNRSRDLNLKLQQNVNVNEQRGNPKRPLSSTNRPEKRNGFSVSLVSSREIRGSGVEETGMYFSDVGASIYHVILPTCRKRSDGIADHPPVNWQVDKDTRPNWRNRNFRILPSSL